MRIAVTRSKSQLKSLASKAALKSIEIIPLPLLEIRSRAFSWPNEIDLENLAWVFFTSSNGVDSFLSRLDSIGCKLPRHTKIAVVGSKTREALQRRGYSASFQPSEPYGRLLFSEFIDHISDRSVIHVYARAKDVDYDPEQLFLIRKLQYRAIECYEAIEQNIEQRVVSKIKREDMILFTAPSTVRAYHRQFGDPEARLLAIGHTTAAEMDRHRWANYTVLREAEVESVLEYV